MLIETIVDFIAMYFSETFSVYLMALFVVRKYNLKNIFSKNIGLAFFHAIIANIYEIMIPPLTIPIGVKFSVTILLIMSIYFRFMYIETKNFKKALCYSFLLPTLLFIFEMITVIIGCSLLGVKDIDLTLRWVHLFFINIRTAFTILLFILIEIIINCKKKRV